MVHNLVQQPRGTSDVPNVVGRGPGLHQSIGPVVPRGTFDTSALRALGVGHRNVWETRDCQVHGPEPDRPTNTKAFPCTLYKYTVAAMCEPVELVDPPPIGQNIVATCQVCEENGSTRAVGDPDSGSPPVPGHLLDLYERSSHLLDPTKRSQLAQLLIEYADVFAVSPVDLGYTSLVTHMINTGSSTAHPSAGETFSAT